MRIKLFFAPNQEEITKHLNDEIIKGLHICLGNNNRWHNGKSPYSISQLNGGKIGKNGYIQYPNGGWLIVSSTDEEFLCDFFNGLFERKNQIKIETMRLIDYKTYNIKVGERFDLVRIEKLRLKVNDKEITYKDDSFLKLVEEQCIRKLKARGFTDDDFKTFKLEPFHEEKWKVSYPKNKLYLKNPVITPSSSLMLILKGKREIREELIHLGIGNSTGAGFGFVKLKEDNKIKQDLKY